MSATFAAAVCSGRWSSSADRASKTTFDPALKLNERIKAEGIARGLATYPMGGTIDGKQGDHLISRRLTSRPLAISTRSLNAWATRWTRRFSSL